MSATGQLLSNTVDSYPDVARCHGCGLCALVCPVYQHGGSVMATPHGIAKVKQCGAELDKADVMACVLCGACAAICPQSINLMQLLVAARTEVSQFSEVETFQEQLKTHTSTSILIADQSLQDHADTLHQALQSLGQGFVLAQDSGTDISRAMQEGRPVSHARLHQFLTSLQSVKHIVISDGLLFQLIREKLPQISMHSLGQLLSSRNEVGRQLDEHDLYIMDAQLYHANYAEAVLHYDCLQQSSGCQLARDLHRLAVTTGAQAGNHDDSRFDQQRQIDWLMKGVTVQRVVTESAADAAMLAQHIDTPVVHVTALSAL
jgi:heterodisulfide reductase subunit C